MEKKYAVGIDIGGTNTVVAVVDRRGEILSRGEIRTNCCGDNIGKYIDVLASEISQVINMSCTSEDVVGIGIGAPCANFINGVIEAATDLPWPSPIPLKDMVEKTTGLPVAVTNDANAAAAGEMNYGAARGMSDFIMITLGTGVGSGIVCNGVLLTGHQGFAGELGHCSVRRESDRDCGCGRKGCLQTYCSASGVVRTALELMANSLQPSSLRSVAPEVLTSRMVYDAAVGGDALAMETLRFTGEILGECCADFASFSDPEAIILFGGVAKAGKLITEPMREAMERRILHLYKGKVRILTSTLPEAEAAILGAAALAWKFS